MNRANFFSVLLAVVMLMSRGAWAETSVPAPVQKLKMKQAQILQTMDDKIREIEFQHPEYIQKNKEGFEKLKATKSALKSSLKSLENGDVESAFRQQADFFAEVADVMQEGLNFMREDENPKSPPIGTFLDKPGSQVRFPKEKKMTVGPKPFYEAQKTDPSDVVTHAADEESEEGPKTESYLEALTDKADKNFKNKLFSDLERKSSAASQTEEAQTLSPEGSPKETPKAQSQTLETAKPDAADSASAETQGTSSDQAASGSGGGAGGGAGAGSGSAKSAVAGNAAEAGASGDGGAGSGMGIGNGGGISAGSGSLSAASGDEAGSGQAEGIGEGESAGESGEGETLGSGGMDGDAGGGAGGGAGAGSGSAKSAAAGNAEAGASGDGGAGSGMGIGNGGGIFAGSGGLSAASGDEAGSGQAEGIGEGESAGESGEGETLGSGGMDGDAGGGAGGGAGAGSGSAKSAAAGNAAEAGASGDGGAGSGMGIGNGGGISAGSGGLSAASGDEAGSGQAEGSGSAQDGRSGYSNAALLDQSQQSRSLKTLQDRTEAEQNRWEANQNDWVRQTEQEPLMEDQEKAKPNLEPLDYEKDPEQNEDITSAIREWLLQEKILIQEMKRFKPVKQLSQTNSPWEYYALRQKQFLVQLKQLRRRIEFLGRRDEYMMELGKYSEFANRLLDLINRGEYTEYDAAAHAIDDLIQNFELLAADENEMQGEAFTYKNLNKDNYPKKYDPEISQYFKMLSEG